MPFKLNQTEIAAFLQRNPRVAADIDSHRTGTGWTYSGNIPRNGGTYPARAYKDTDGHYVLVWLTAGYRWEFVDLRDMPNVAVELNKPEFFSPSGDVFESITNPLASLGTTMRGAVQTVKETVDRSLGELEKTLNWTRTTIVVVIVIIGLVLLMVAYRGVEAPGLRIG